MTKHDPAQVMAQVMAQVIEAYENTAPTSPDESCLILVPLPEKDGQSVASGVALLHVVASSEYADDLRAHGWPASLDSAAGIVVRGRPYASVTWMRDAIRSAKAE